MPPSSMPPRIPLTATHCQGRSCPTLDGGTPSSTALLGALPQQAVEHGLQSRYMAPSSTGWIGCFLAASRRVRLRGDFSGGEPSSILYTGVRRPEAVEPRALGSFPASGRRARRGCRIFRRGAAEHGHMQGLHGDAPESTAPRRLFRYPAVESLACLCSAASRRRVSPGWVFSSKVRYSVPPGCLLRRFAVAYTALMYTILYGLQTTGSSSIHAMRRYGHGSRCRPAAILACGTGFVCRCRQRNSWRRSSPIRDYGGIIQEVVWNLRAGCSIRRARCSGSSI
jgi:hypothetical protein